MANIRKKETKRNGTVYEVRVESMRDSSGKRRQISKTFKKLKDAKAWASEQENLINKGVEVDIESKNLKIKDFVPVYLTALKNDVKDSTYFRYVSSARYITQELGNIKLKSLKASHLKDFINKLYENGMSESSLKKVIVQLSLMIKAATEDELIFKEVKLPKKPKYSKKEIEVWDKEQAVDFIKGVKGELIYVPCVIAFETGLRAGEVCGLRWGDIDLENEIINVRKSYDINRFTGEYEFRELKTEGSERTIFMLPNTIRLLKSEYAKNELNKRIFGEEYNPNNSVCCMDSGNTIRPAYLSKRFRIAADRYGYNKVTFHGLRHTHASILIASDVNLKVIQHRMGHSRLSTTLDIYSHLLKKVSKKELPKASEAFNNNLI